MTEYKYILMIEGLQGVPDPWNPEVKFIGWGGEHYSGTGEGGLGTGRAASTPPKSIRVDRSIDAYSGMLRLANESGAHMTKITAKLEWYQSKDGQDTATARVTITLKSPVVDSYAVHGGVKTTGLFERVTFVSKDSDISYV
jgi:Type VI secretion system effector, Hcp